MTSNETLRGSVITPNLDLELDFVNCKKCGLIKLKKWHNNFELCSKTCSTF